MIKRSVVLAALVLSACATAPQRQAESPHAPIVDRSATAAQPVARPVAGSGGYLVGDGPDDHVPANLDATPDAVPVSEPLHRYANQPYMALDKSYTPMTVPGQYKQRGIASWYGKKFNGQRTSSGEKYNMYAMTAAHPTLPIPSFARVTSVANGKSVVVRINDRGPFLHGRVIDLSYTAAHKLGVIGVGSAEVEVESLIAYAGTRTQPVQSTPLSEPARVVSAPIVTASDSQVTDSSPATGGIAASGGHAFLQLGAFTTQDAAEKFLAQMHEKLGDVGIKLVLFNQNNKTRVHIGPYASVSDARNSRFGLKDKLGFLPVLSLH